MEGLITLLIRNTDTATLHPPLTGVVRLLTASRITRLSLHGEVGPTTG